MESHHKTAPDDLVTIARNASLYEWLLNISRRAPQRLPPALHEDFGLPRPPDEPLWQEWRRFAQVNS